VLFLKEEASDFSEMFVALLACMISHAVDITSTVFLLRNPNKKILILKPFGLVHRPVLKEKIKFREEAGFTSSGNK
jgi:hypothetical protein